MSASRPPKFVSLDAVGFAHRAHRPNAARRAANAATEQQHWGAKRNAEPAGEAGGVKVVAFAAADAVEPEAALLFDDARQRALLPGVVARHAVVDAINLVFWPVDAHGPELTLFAVPSPRHTAEISWPERKGTVRGVGTLLWIEVLMLRGDVLQHEPDAQDNEAEAFLIKWTDDHVGLVHQSQGNQESKHLVRACLQDCIKQGITSRRIIATCAALSQGGRMHAYMLQALKAFRSRNLSNPVHGLNLGEQLGSRQVFQSLTHVSPKSERRTRY